jgi:hypothetical protein
MIEFWVIRNAAKLTGNQSTEAGAGQQFG